MPFKEKVVIITGASGGIGSETARMFAREGATIVVNYLSSPKKANKTLEAVTRFGVEAMKVKADVSKPNEVQSMIDCSIQEFGKIDVLVNNASKHPPPLFNFRKPDWEG